MRMVGGCGMMWYEMFIYMYELIGDRMHGRCQKNKLLDYIGGMMRCFMSSYVLRSMQSESFE